MTKRFLIFGCLGWCIEILWTGFHSLLLGDGALTAKTYLRCGGVCFASISGGTEKLSALAEAWAIQRDHLSGGICRRRADSSGNRRLPLGLWEQSPFRSGVNPSGLRAALGSLGVFFRGGQLASGKERRIGVGHCSSD